MAFRRRRRSVQWLPNTVTNRAGVNFYFDSVVVDPTFETRRTNLYMLTNDYPASAIRTAGQVTSLADWEGSAYRLRRFVGKFICAMSNTQPDQAQESVTAAVITAGLMVIRVDEAAGAPLRLPDAYSPMGLDNVQDPWIWRRTWVLQNDFSNNPIAASWQFPRCNADYGGGMQDGCHIDAKVGRVIRDEERLAFLVSSYNVTGTVALAGEVRFMLDYRILASSLRRAGNRGNASR